MDSDSNIIQEVNKTQKQALIPLPPDVLMKNLSITLTKLDLSNKKIVSESLDDIILPENLEILILVQNNLNVLPGSVTKLRKLKKLDVSNNNIIYFNETPKFSQDIEDLDLSNNNLKCPPYWVWTDSPQNLRYLNLSLNEDLTTFLPDSCYQELIQYTTSVTHLDIFNCRLQNHLELLGTFSKLKSLKLGANDFRFSKLNFIEKFPIKGLENCCDIEAIDLRNTKIYTIDTNINIYRNLKELNLSLNNISYLPIEICDLETLELLALSFNELLYLPENIVKLKNLKKLYLDNNQLCVVPEDLSELEKLETLDLYNNHLYEVPNIQHILETDIAQNYCNEPEDDEYVTKKLKLRGHLEFAEKRLDGPDTEDVRSPEQHHSEGCSGDEWNEQEDDTNEKVPASLEVEDWDSDDYWVPHHPRPNNSFLNPWDRFLMQKLREGNFCPSDMHQMSVAEKVKYEKMGKPKFSVEVIGQFDDLSD